ncbi:LPXTG cell wall anchor domain-containing protein [Collinsella sp. CLA-ER-H8]|uniref:LPXTG cell wall anchor domain-containing protein n=1 Tax=Collinsella sp. CLA-ER-H8 TaxID=3136229 RepID=UPI0032C182BA
MNDILARRARRATMGIALSVALVTGIAPATAIAAETSSPTGAVALQTNAASDNPAASSETLAAEKDKAYAAMQEALKNLEAAKDAASPEKLAEIDDDIAAFQELYDMVVAEAAKRREPLPAMQANVDAAQAKYDEAHNRTSGLQAELNKALEALGDEEPSTAIKEQIKQLRSEIMSAERREESCEDDLHRYQRRLESQEKQVQYFESEAEEAKAHIDEDIAKRNALLGDLEKAQAAYDDACKAYEEAKAAADKTTSPEITKPAETVPPSGSTQPAEATPPVASPATGKDALPSSTKQANLSSGKQADTTAGKLANTGDTAPSAIALAGIAAAGLGITATATRRIRNSK